MGSIAPDFKNGNFLNQFWSKLVLIDQIFHSVDFYELEDTESIDPNVKMTKFPNMSFQFGMESCVRARQMESMVECH